MPGNGFFVVMPNTLSRSRAGGNVLPDDAISLRFFVLAPLRERYLSLTLPPASF